MTQRFQPPQMIAVDVDGTLSLSGVPNTKLIEWLRERRDEGFTLTLWSARGEAHARNAAELFGVTDLFAAIISKPGYIVDDKGWSWIRFTQVVTAFCEVTEDPAE